MSKKKKTEPTVEAAEAADKETPLTPEQKTILNGVIEAIKVLYERHIADIMRIREREIAPKVKITFPVTIDYGEGPDASLKIDMAWSLTMRDSLVVISAGPEPADIRFYDG